MRVERAATRAAGVPSNTILAAVVARARPQVDDPVGVRHDRLMVRDDDDRLAGVDEPEHSGLVAENEDPEVVGSVVVAAHDDETGERAQDEGQQKQHRRMVEAV